MDVLDMFTHLEWSYEQLDDAEREALGEWASRAVRFAGFDLNQCLEGRLLYFARHLIEQDKWERLAVYFDDKHERGNSHSRMLDVYERMLEEFNPIWRQKIRSNQLASSGSYTLTADEIDRVVKARIHPDNR